MASAIVRQMPITRPKQNAAEADGDSQYLTICEAATVVKVSQPTIRRCLTKGTLKRYKFLGRTLIKRCELLALVREAK